MSNIVELSDHDIKKCSSEFTALNENDLFQIFQTRFDEHVNQNKLDIQTYEEKVNELNQMSKQASHKKLSPLLTEYKEVIASTIINTFGLGPFFHHDPEKGADVTTIHNAQQGFYADEKDEYRRADYNYEKTRENMFQNMQHADGTYTDGYTGKNITRDRANVEHVVPIESFHKKGGYMLDKKRKKAFANDKQNLLITDSSLNSSKRNQDLDAFKNEKSAGREIDNKTYFEMDDRRAKPAAERANKAFDAHKPSWKDKASFYTKRGAISGASDGLKLGLRQAFGMIFYTFTSELFHAMKHFMKHIKTYYKENTVFQNFKKMLQKVYDKTMKKMKGVVKAFKDGFISGFLSNVLTTIINCFKTTYGRMNRIIREGILSIYKALKLLLFKPEGMTKQEAVRESIKLLITGIVVAGGIVLEGAFEAYLTSLMPTHPQLANIISTTIISIITGITAATLVYLIDQLIGKLPSTNELIEKTDQLMKRSTQMKQDYATATEGIYIANNTTDYLARMKKSDKQVDDLIDFFEE